MTSHAGSNIIKLGEYWKSIFLKGKSIAQIAAEHNRPVQVVSRAIWLGGWPQHLKDLVYQNPSVFTMDKLVNGFGAKRRQCEQNNFAVLEREIRRMIELGTGSRPKLKKTNKPQPKCDDVKVDLTLNIQKSQEAEYRIKSALSLHSRVGFEKNGGGEVRIFFSNEKDLNFILERLEDVKFNSSSINALDSDFWASLEN